MSSIVRRLDVRSSAILREVDRERRREIAGAAAQAGRVERRGRSAVDARAPAAHEVLPFERLERANEHRGGRSLVLGHRVHEIVHAVVEVDVRAARRTVERRVACRRSGRRMTRWIALADVGLGLDDHAGDSPAAHLVDEHLADQIFQDGERRAAVKNARKNHTDDWAIGLLGY